MPKAKHLGKEMILAAMAKTKSNKAAARYLNCSYIHYKKWAKKYEATQPGYTDLFEQHKNQSGKGIPKFLSNGSPRKEFALLDLKYMMSVHSNITILFYNIYFKYDK
jgi:hypothetical protein